MSHESDFTRLVETGKGKPAGELLRRYWQPVALVSDLGKRPLAITVMGEELVLFRDPTGKVGLLSRYCPHRATDLSYGRIEDGGLRCLYHGWMMDIRGRCLDQPAEPIESTYKDEIRHPAYPCREAAGAIFAYLGPGEPPLFPNFHFLSAPDAHVHQTRLHHACNYLQANEGNIDPAHLSFLHSFRKPLADRQQDAQKLQNVLIRNTRPKSSIARTRYGMRVFATRAAEDRKSYVRITNFVFPNLGFFAGDSGQRGPGGYAVHWHVPIDDESHWRYDFYYHRAERLDKSAMDALHSEEADANNYPRRGPANHYLQNGEEMENFSFAGMGRNFSAHDLFAVQSPGAIHDRSREHLASSDVAIVAMRRMMLDAMRDLEEGKEPPLVLRSANENVFNDIVVLGALLDEGQDQNAYCEAIVRNSDYHALQV
ncbi:MAG TPA: Rieske 2Fe-2S domain-containing protein [Stellaceae bacterium]|jgi:phenylpropionate dioxygenase-like ring-hydroxylating dioxygenase large terminal subunit|nr:Rieske 2Fe-2S domain-containing protein [Stellaceae bacterium]